MQGGMHPSGPSLGQESGVQIVQGYAMKLEAPSGKGPMQAKPSQDMQDFWPEAGIQGENGQSLTA